MGPYIARKPKPMDTKVARVVSALANNEYNWTTTDRMHQGRWEDDGISIRCRTCGWVTMNSAGNHIDQWNFHRASEAIREGLV